MKNRCRNFFFLLLGAWFATVVVAADERPNVVFVITDDQGYGDLGFTGNPIIQTPHLDKLAGESVWLKDYHVAPSCSPTRSALLTGRWTNRTGVWHTFYARAMMYEDEVTIADHFQSSGYATGMFGKWHLGDHFPFRPQDRGFDEVFCLKGGAIGVTADYWNNDYFDDHYYHNEKVVKTEGYVTDVFFEAGSRFIREQVAGGKPFFAYLSTNAPHKPWVCPPKFSGMYPDQSKSAAAFYGMVTNIDENVGRLRELLEELGVAENTIFIFTTDNGSVGPKKFNAGMRGGKISPYEGGHRVPFALHWPKGGFSRHTPVPELTHMTDVLPTLLDLCDLAPAEEALDGRSIRDLLDGQGDDSFDWESRTVISDSQRIQVPKKWKDSSVMSGKWRLVKGTELYHIGDDPGQKTNLAEQHPERFEAMREWYENWWAELEPTFTRTSEIYIGADEAPEVVLTALQWIDAYPPWNQGIIRKAPFDVKRAGIKFSGHWAVNVEKDGAYTFEVRRWPEESGLKIREGTAAHPPEPGTLPSYSAPAGRAVPITAATLRIDDEDLETKPVTDKDRVIRFTHQLTSGSHKFSPYFTLAGDSGKELGELGAYYVTVSPALKEEAGKKPDTIPSDSKASLRFEGEDLVVLKKAGNPRVQSLKNVGGGKWSGGEQLWWREAKPGDEIVFALPIAGAGEYSLAVALTKARDYGIVQFSLDGENLGDPLDLYSSKVELTGDLMLSEKVKLDKGQHELSVRITGSNPKALPKHLFGLDYVAVMPLGVEAAMPNSKAPSSSAPKKGIKEGNAAEAEPRSPGEQLAAFQGPEGFEVELVASEETGVPKPVSLAFDDAGRLWTQTAIAYPRDRDPDIWTKPGPDHIVVIDQPHLAEPQDARVFAKGMVMPMGVLPWGNSAIVAQGPEILKITDTDGDGVADERTTLLRGFGVQDTHTLPHQLVRLPGRRIGFSQGVLNGGTIMDAAGKSHPFNKTLIASVAPDGNDLEIMGVGMNNIWAWAEDRLGRVFIHEANDWGYSLVPFERDSSYPSFVSSLIHPDAPLHPPTAQDLGLGGTGFSGIAICDDRSGSFPKPWQGRFFVANPILGKINSVSGIVGEDGVWKFTKEADLVTCQDPMFRPVAVSFGPDGCLYIADWYNRIISHNEVARDHPARDKTHGRIWRVRAKGQKRRKPTDFTKVPTEDLPRALSSGSSWSVQAALNQIGERQKHSIIPDLIERVQAPNISAEDRIALLRALENLGHFDGEVWATLLLDPEPNLRREVVRSLTTLRIGQDEATPILQTLADETAWMVRYEVLRYFRQMEGEISKENLAWLSDWSASPAPVNQVKGMKGQYLALDGSYQRAFQDFLFQMAKTKTSLPVIEESKWSKVIDRHESEIDEVALGLRAKEITAALEEVKPADGKLLAQSLCLTCHAIGGEGVGFAPPLDGFAARDLDGAITAILHPSAAIENVFRAYRIETKDGKTFEGFKKSEVRGTITLLSMGGAPQRFPIKNIKNAGYIEGRSVMPDLATGLGAEQIASIIAYLKSVDGKK